LSPDLTFVVVKNVNYLLKKLRAVWKKDFCFWERVETNVKMAPWIGNQF